MPLQREIAEHLDLDQSSVSRMLASVNVDWRTASMDEIRVAYIRKLRASAAAQASANGDDLVAERVMSERVDRELKQLTLAEKKGQLVNVTQLEDELTQMVGAFRTDVLALPDRLKVDLDLRYGVEVDIDILTKHVHDTLAQLARYDPEQSGARAAPGEGAPAAGADVDAGMGEGAASAQ